MITLGPQTAQDASELYDAYRKLPESEQALLQLLAVVYHPLGVSKFNEVLKLSAHFELFAVKKPIKRLSAELRTQLIEQGFILQGRDGILVHYYIGNQLVADCVQNNTFKQILHCVDQAVQRPSSYSFDLNLAAHQRLIRDCYFLGEIDNIIELLEFDKNPQNINMEYNQVLIHLFLIPFDLQTFLALPDILQYQSFACWILSRQRQGYSVTYALDLLKQVHQHNPGNIQLSCLLAEQYLYQAQLTELKTLIPELDDSCYALQIKASYLFLTGEFSDANAHFEHAIKAKNKIKRRTKQYLSGPMGVFYKLCLLRLGNTQDASFFKTAGAQVSFEATDRTMRCMPHENVALSESMVMAIQGISSGQTFTASTVRYAHLSNSHCFYFNLAQLINLLAELWCNKTLKAESLNKLQQVSDFFEGSDYALFREIARQIKTPESSAEISALLHFPTFIRTKEEWDVALDKLLALTNETTTTNVVEKSEHNTRLIWEVEFSRFRANFKPKEQKLNNKGWSKGRVIALKRLYREVDQFPYLTEQDINICQTIVEIKNWGYYSSTEYHLNGPSTLLAAKGADNLYLAGELSAPIELSQKEPELLVSQQGEHLCLSIADLPEHFEHMQTPCTITQLTPEHYCFTLFSAEHMQVAQVIGEGGLLIPLHAKEKALKGISAIAPLLNIQSDLNELDTGLENIQCDPHLVINIQPFNQGLEFSCFVMPFGEQGPVIKPAVGNVNLTTELNGKRVATQRDLIHEQNLLDLLDQHCSSFLSMPDNILAIDDTQAALDTLEQLEHIVSQSPAPLPLKLRWPKGKKINLSKRLESQHMQLAVNKKNEWFDITGELKIDDEAVIDLRRLLELVSTSNGRFIQLDSNQILALSEDLRHKLEALKHSTEDGKFHPLASLQVEEATAGMRMKPIHAWEAQTRKMHEANEITPQVPNTLQAQLRDYQIAGFDWASRLAHWGAGACLADDMGLGKTLQALAILLSRAKGGPSLVMAPTSVCLNWLQEAAKFAPTLNIKLFADSVNNQQRSDLLQDLNASDCVIISYGLLQRESEMLAKVRWHTIIADEAQALKNPLAKRTKAAYALKADFKMVTTGTPIENDLTELWSLFRFINPGLLGNIKRFGERFALPIENANEDKLAARKASIGLRNLIKPFILRRMKNQVLTELPSRTEITLQVELNTEEQNFYQALRLNAIDKLSAADNFANAGEQRIQMLAELVKLRQACCHPKLVMQESNIPSSKLAALDELLDELQQNNHKALIFSQFVGHLHLIKTHLENKGIQYQYLDGSTPQKERQQRVNAFQNGEGDVFLISLKAGGFGLNLTAADYVIHMDPWWNPAVEEQASDRAHRMGQTRPVTIYRLVAKNTIEEKIVALHQHKRDLADNLLQGNEQANKLSVDDMLILLKDTF
ncbi:DEAD/DEAH box helicase [Catenovulum sediminis]|uniref:DEAD/DEAH box helicase n=1 Tax=Catenovulum sediminis TaxID=1740262 RepID=UPI00117F2AC9|nr:DEAD/DEAH box helicase [Catenovulum sediminis]